MAQSGSVQVWGTWGRRFKSYHSDQKNIDILELPIIDNEEDFVVIKENSIA